MNSRAFTIVELLIVIVVIAILASISVVAYNGIQDRANNSAVISDLSIFAKKFEIERINNDGIYPSALSSTMDLKFSKSSYGVDYQGRNLRYCHNATLNKYVLYANSKSGNYYKVINGRVESAASTYGFGVCREVDLDNTNPSQNGYYNAALPEWASWTN